MERLKRLLLSKKKKEVASRAEIRIARDVQSRG